MLRNCPRAEPVFLETAVFNTFVSNAWKRKQTSHIGSDVSREFLNAVRPLDFTISFILTWSCSIFHLNTSFSMWFRTSSSLYLFILLYGSCPLVTYELWIKILLTLDTVSNEFFHLYVEILRGYKWSYQYLIMYAYVYPSIMFFFFHLFIFTAL